MKKTLTSSLLILMFLSVLLMPPATDRASAATQEDISAAELLNELAEQLTNIGRRYQKRGESTEARAWFQWASTFRAGAAGSGRVSANKLISENIKFYRAGARQAEAARLYGIAKVFSIWRDFWIEVRDNLSDDVSDLDVSFPKSLLFLFASAPVSTQSAVPRMCDQAAYNKCMEVANSMTSSTYDYGTGTSRSTGVSSSGLMMRNTCRMYLAGCN
ncbi:MAG TPA: hypothetical protein VEX70_03570 [Pyrinomonadaceae bacterium]|jgi:hypothetical protein|nr:hypothetical protein [Pyrinomonadaceae bacterium]